MNDRFEDYEDKKEEETDGEKSEKSTHKDSVRLLTMIQIIGCAAILIAAVCIRISGGELYKTVRSWYFDAFNDSIISDEQAENVKHTVIDLWSSVSSARGGSSSMQISSKPQSGTLSSNTQQSSAPQQNQVSGNSEGQ